LSPPVLRCRLRWAQWADSSRPDPPLAVRLLEQAWLVTQFPQSGCIRASFSRLNQRGFGCMFYANPFAFARSFAETTPASVDTNGHCWRFGELHQEDIPGPQARKLCSEGLGRRQGDSFAMEFCRYARAYLSRNSLRAPVATPPQAWNFSERNARERDGPDKEQLAVSSSRVPICRT
jgi:hypothetical protein